MQEACVEKEITQKTTWKYDNLTWQTEEATK